MKGRLEKDTKRLFNKHNHEYWEQEALERRANKAEIEYNKDNLKTETPV